MLAHGNFVDPFLDDVSVAHYLALDFFDDSTDLSFAPCEQCGKVVHLTIAGRVVADFSRSIQCPEDRYFTVHQPFVVCAHTLGEAGGGVVAGGGHLGWPFVFNVVTLLYTQTMEFGATSKSFFKNFLAAGGQIFSISIHQSADSRVRV